MTEDMERVHHAISGQVIQLATLASHAAELGVQLAARRAAEVERRSRSDAAQVGQRLRADRELAAVLWSRTRSSSWLAAAGSEELIQVWASARAWAPLDTRAARAVDAVARRVADLGVQVDEAVAALDARDAAALGRLLADRVGGGRGEGTAGGIETGLSGLEVEQEQRVLAALKGEWAAATIDAITADDAFGALAHKLARAEADGHELATVLGALPEAEIVASGIRHPAAFAAWLVDRWAATGQSVRVAGRAWSRPQSEAHRSGPARPRSTSNAATGGTTRTSAEELQR